MRKNKTLGAIFKHKSVLSVLEKNYNTVREAAGQMNDEENFKEKVVKIIETFALGDLRANKMDNDDFLNTLAIFNRHGIHFN
jgi:18S rRNA (adenine1779-N6/adenine1780-N6)-dimethyltransferase